MDGDAGTRRMINRWIGPGSDVGLSQESIRSLYGLILSVTAEINIKDRSIACPSSTYSGRT